MTDWHEVQLTGGDDPALSQVLDAAATLPAVAISPNTCMAAARQLARDAQVYRTQGRMGDAEVCEQLAGRLAKAQQDAGWPDPLDPWPGS